MVIGIDSMEEEEEEGVGELRWKILSRSPLLKLNRPGDCGLSLDCLFNRRPRTNKRD